MQASGHNAAAVALALTARNAVDIGGMGVAFAFRTHEEMWLAREFLSDVNNPGNIRWAFHLSAVQVQDIFDAAIPAIHQPRCTPKIETHMLTAYSEETGQVTHDIYKFFALP